MRSFAWPEHKDDDVAWLGLLRSGASNPSVGAFSRPARDKCRAAAMPAMLPSTRTEVEAKHENLDPRRDGYLGWPTFTHLARWIAQHRPHDHLAIASYIAAEPVISVPISGEAESFVKSDARPEAELCSRFRYVHPALVDLARPAFQELNFG